MSRVRFMSPYLKGGRDTAKLSNRARYIATRPGVEVLRGEHSDQPATKKQQAYIQRLLRDFPGAEELLEYEDYQKNPTVERANASGINISEYTLRRAIRTRQLPCKVIGRTYLIPWDGFLRWVSCEQ